MLKYLLVLSRQTVTIQQMHLIFQLVYLLLHHYQFVQIINPHVAHIGVGIAIIGITCSSVFKGEYSYSLKEGDKFQIENIRIVLEKIETTMKIMKVRYKTDSRKTLDIFSEVKKLNIKTSY